LNREKLLAKITEKWPVKILSLAAAVIISVSYRMSTLETRFFSVPLQIESSETLIPAVVFASTVRISLRGEADGIQPILEEDIEAYIDLTRYTAEGNYRVPVQIRKKGSALGVEPLEISVLPIEIPLLLEQRVTKNISVFPVLSGTVAQGYELTYQSLIPGSVIAEGPRSVLDSRLDFYTETINLDRRYDDFSIMVNIINDNPLISIQGNRMHEFRGSISLIAREEPVYIYEHEVVIENEIEHDELPQDYELVDSEQ
jgi:YbbR domain-containing protein